MKSSSERTLPSAVSSRPETSSRTGAATSTATRAAERGMFEPGVIAVMHGVTNDPALPFPYLRRLAPYGSAPAAGPVAGVLAGGAFVAVPVGAGPAGHDELGVAGDHLGQELLRPAAAQGARGAAVVGDGDARVAVLLVLESGGFRHGRMVPAPAAPRRANYGTDRRGPVSGARSGGS